MRIKGWMGRADQRTKVRACSSIREQIAEIARKHPELGRLRLVIRLGQPGRHDDAQVEAPSPSADLEKVLEGSHPHRVQGRRQWSSSPSRQPAQRRTMVIDELRKYT